MEQDKTIVFENKKILWFFFVLFLLSIWLMHTDGDKVSGDGHRYFTLCRNLFFHQDLVVHEDPASVPNPAFPEMARDGMLRTPFSIGPAIVWMPFYSIAHVLFIISHDTPPNGYEPIYQFMVSLGTITAVFSAFLLLFAMLRSLGFPGDIAFLSILFTYLGTSLFNYTVLESTMSHGLSFFTLTLFLYSWWRYRHSPTFMNTVLMGLALGLAFNIRYINALWGVLPLVDLIRRTRPFKTILLYGTGALIGFLPQLLAWNAMFGSLVTVPQGEHFMVWNNPRWAELLFSHNHGLISLQFLLPIALFVAVWTIFKKSRPHGIIVLLIFSACIYANSAAWDWNAGHSFGSRRLDAFFPLVALGIAEVHSFCRKKKKWFERFFLLAVIFFLFVNFSALYIYKKNAGLRMDAMSPKRIASTMFDIVGSPLHLPVNIVNSLRWQVLPGQAEQLFGNTPRFNEDSYFIHNERHREFFLGGWSDEDFFVNHIPYRKIRLNKGKIGFQLIRRHEIRSLVIAAFSEKPSSILITINHIHKHKIDVSGETECRIDLGKHEFEEGFNQIGIRNETPGSSLSVAWLKLFIEN